MEKFIAKSKILFYFLKRFNFNSIIVRNLVLKLLELILLLKQLNKQL